MLQATNFGCLLVALWGMAGIWTTKLGYHNLWEFWFFNAQFGFTMGAQFSYGQAFMAELVPRGREYMFFSLLGIVSKGSGKSARRELISSIIADCLAAHIRPLSPHANQTITDLPIFI
jgi:MFS-type transporter involved in bile tolerance (Atg22 family)